VINHASLVFAGGAFDRLRDNLLGSAPLETAAFVLARPVHTPSGALRLVVYSIIDVGESEYIDRSPHSIELPPSVVAAVMQRARNETAAIIATHSHPFSGAVSPSAVDLRGEISLFDAFRRRVPGIPHGRMIVGLDGIHAAIVLERGHELAMRVMSVGPDVLQVATAFAPDGDGSASLVRFDRQVRAFGENGQRSISQLRVGIVGLGGTGSVVAQQLAHLGVTSFFLCDPDAVEPTNLNRVIGASVADVGRTKVQVAGDAIRRVTADAKVFAVQADVCDADTARRLLDVDVVFVCTDSQGSRAVLAQLAYQYFIPMIDVGVAVRAVDGRVTHVTGRVQMLAPGLGCLLCCNTLDPETVRRDLLTAEARAADPYIVGAIVPQPAVVSINSAASSLAVTMMLSAFTGIPYRSRYQLLRLESGVVSSVEATPNPECPVCSQFGAFARGDSWPVPGRIAR